MRLFQTISQRFEFLTNYRVQSFQTDQRCNVKIAIGIFLNLAYAISSLMFLLIDAHTIGEYADGFFASSSGICNFIAILFLIWNAKQICALFDVLNVAVLECKLIIFSNSQLTVYRAASSEIVANVSSQTFTHI